MIIILGTPGAGKTTQTRLLAEHLGCKWFSTGELIRQNATGKDRQEMLAGKIISDQTTLNIIDKALSSVDTADQECVFEGNPRSVTQAKWWFKQVEDGRFKIRGVIHLVVSTEVAQQRLEKRGRLDDHDRNVIEKRFEEYHRSISPVLDYLKQHDVKVHEVDADGSIDDISRRINQLLEV